MAVPQNNVGTLGIDPVNPIAVTELANTAVVVPIPLSNQVQLSTRSAER